MFEILKFLTSGQEFDKWLRIPGPEPGQQISVTGVARLPLTLLVPFFFLLIFILTFIV